MGWASEQQIEEFNALYESDADFRAAYDEQRQFEAYQEAVYFERERELEMLEEWFDDKLIDHAGEPVELPKPEPVFLIDDDLPF